ncbi:MAG: thiamine pyrophosphate-dependent enzyme [Lautropia sp.]
MQLTGGQALALQLRKEGLDTIFGVPGVQLDWAVDGLRQLGGAIRLIVPRHEQATSYMADGYARSSGRIGVCMTVPGPGLTNALAGLATAYSCSSPVLAIVGQIHSAALGGGYGMLHEIRDQSGMLASVTKWRALATTPAQVPALVREAVDRLRRGRPQPVGLELPHDVLAAQGEVALIDPPAAGAAGAAPPGTAPPGTAPLDAAALDAAARLLAQAHLPVICAGGGVIAADASAALQRLAERLQAPVVMAEMGRGALPDSHPLAVTTLPGRVLIRHADVVLVVGSRFMSRMAVAPAWSAAQTRFVDLNIEPADMKWPRQPGIALAADARLGLEALLDAVARVAGDGPAPSRTAQVAAARRWAEPQMAAIEPQGAWCRALRRAIPADGILVSELTQVGYFSTIGYPVEAPRTYLAPGYQGTLGYGFPTALGVAVAHPDRTVVAITGDGGFGWGLQELATARRYDLNLITVVFNDGRFGNVELLQRATFGHTIATELCNPDFAKLADAFGIGYACCDGADGPAELERAIAAARSRGGPTLIEARVGAMPNAWHLFRLQSAFKATAPEPDDPLA